MCRRTQRRIAVWLGVAALLCQVFLPFGLARLADVGGGLPAQAAHEHHHDPGLPNSLGGDWRFGHSHAGDKASSRVRLDLAYLTPFTLLDAPASPAATLSWAAFVAYWIAPVLPAPDSFSRPLPRAPPLSA